MNPVDWFNRAYDFETSELGKDVIHFLHDWYGGIYNFANACNFERVNWWQDHHIKLSMRGHMSTIDNDLLTNLVVMSHDRMLRVDIGASNFTHLSLLFHRRTSRNFNDGANNWMPTMDSHVQMLQEYTKQKE